MPPAHMTPEACSVNPTADWDTTGYLQRELLKSRLDPMPETCSINPNSDWNERLVVMTRCSSWSELGEGHAERTQTSPVRKALPYDCRRCRLASVFASFSRHASSSWKRSTWRWPRSPSTRLRRPERRRPGRRRGGQVTEHVLFFYNEHYTVSACPPDNVVFSILLTVPRK